MCTNCFEGLAASRTSQWTELSISITVSISIEKYEFTQLPVIPIQQHGVHSSFLPFHVCTLDNEEPGSHILNVFTSILCGQFIFHLCPSTDLLLGCSTPILGSSNHARLFFHMDVPFMLLSSDTLYPSADRSFPFYYSFTSSHQAIHSM